MQNTNTATSSTREVKSLFDMAPRSVAIETTTGKILRVPPTKENIKRWRNGEL